MKKPKLIFIMGTPGTGKTTLSYLLASHLEIDQVINTDILRNTLRSIYNAETNPLLFTVTHEAWKLYGEKTNDNVYKAYLNHCMSMYPYIKNLIKKSLEDGRNLIIEGAHVLPFNYEELDLEGYDVCPIYLTINGKEELIDRYQKKNNKRTLPYQGWKENYEIIRYIERCNLLKMINSKNIINIIETTTIEDTFKKAKEIYNEVFHIK